MSARVRPAVETDAAGIAAVHAERINEGLLVRLGPRFLARLYRRIVRSPVGAAFVAEADDTVVGFVAAATSTKAFYRDFLVHDGVPAVLAAFPAIVRAPRPVWETLRYGTADGDVDLPRAEILSIAVSRDATGQGLGGGLLAEALGELGRRGVESARVVTAVGNAPAIAMYERGGFRRHARTEVHRGVAQEVLVWR